MSRVQTRITLGAPAIFVGFLLSTSAALADGPEGRRGPPPEAVEACAALESGDACTVDTPDGELTGSCLAPPKDDNAPLACVPEGAPRPGERGGPPSR
jgi:hypothetical protein